MRKQYEAAYAGYVYEKPETYWTPKANVEKHLTRIDFTKPGKTEVGGVPIISDGKVAYLDGSDNHTVVYAISGMKKSISVFMPTIYSLGRAGENMIITDPKGELYARTSGYLHKEGYDVKCLDFRELNKDGYNILKYPVDLYRGDDPDKGLMMLSNILKTLAAPQKKNTRDPFWADMGVLWCNATGSLMFESYPDPKQVNIMNWTEFNTKGVTELVEKFLDQMRIRNTTTDSMKQIISAADGTLRSILVTATSFFADFKQNSRLMKMLSCSTFELQDLCKEKTALYIVTDDTTSTADALVGIILSQIQTFLVDEAYHNGGSLTHRMNFILDEFASFHIPDMDKALATHRSRRLRYFLCVQTMAALKGKYEQPEALLANCGNTLYLGTTEHELLEKISRELGKSNITADGTERALASPAELMNLKKAWDYKEGIYINLPDTIRYTTILPSIEAYDLGEELPVKIENDYPDIAVYPFAKYFREVLDGVIEEPFPRWCSP